MEYTDFKRLIDSLLVKNKETEWIEFKENFHSKEEIGERISALSNSAFLCNMPYGYMVFGINDDTLKVVGTDFYATRKKVGNEELESWLSTRLNPRIDFEIIDDFDYEANVAWGVDALLSTPQSKVKVAVVTTDEELAIARDTMHLVQEMDE